MMARRAHDLRCALDANENGMRMRNHVIVHVHVCIICTCTCVAPHCGCAWCGRWDAEIMGRIFSCGWYYGAGACCGVQCMCMGPVAIQVDVITRRKGVCTYARVILFRVQGAGCRCKAS